MPLCMLRGGIFLLHIRRFLSFDIDIFLKIVYNKMSYSMNDRSPSLAEEFDKGTDMSKLKLKFSKVYMLHYFKLIYRSLLFLAALIIYICSKFMPDTVNLIWGYSVPLLCVIWLVYFVEMVLRFFPSKYESMGCQKQFTRNYSPREGTVGIPDRQPWQRTLLVFGSWVALNGAIAALYYFGIIDKGILILVSLAYGVCDMICILFFCPFQTWMMKNKCCASCRIYNWDYAMMFTPFLFLVRNLFIAEDVALSDWFAWSLLVLSLILLLRWEVTYRLHPERFYASTNTCLSCENCPEKLCAHKTQLKSFWAKERKLKALKEKLLQKKTEKKTDGDADRADM